MTVLVGEFKHTKAIPYNNLGTSRQVFRNVRGNNRSYKFFIDVDGDLKYQWFNDTVWSSSINIYTVGAVTAFDVKVHDTGTLLDVYVVLIDWQVFDLTYIKGTVGDSADTISWSSAQDIDASLNSTGLETSGVGITRTANGELVVVYNEYDGSIDLDLRAIGSNGDGSAPTWSSDTQMAIGMGEGGRAIPLGIESYSSTYGDRFVIYVRDSIGTIAIKIIVEDWIQGTGFSSVEDDLDLDDVDLKGLSLAIDSNDKVHIAWINDTNDVRHALYPTAGALGTPATVDVTALTAPEFPEAVSLTIDHTNDEVYVFYKKHSETANFYYKKSDVATISFGSETTITIAEDIDYISTGQRDQDGKIVIVSSPEA